MRLMLFTLEICVSSVSEILPRLKTILAERARARLPVTVRRGQFQSTSRKSIRQFQYQLVPAYHSVRQSSLTVVFPHNSQIPLCRVKQALSPSNRGGHCTTLEGRHGE
jgi:hypothetical protein